jgi:hypothetical protein
MDTIKNPLFEWLRGEWILIKSRDFHRFIQPQGDDFFTSAMD